MKTLLRVNPHTFIKPGAHSDGDLTIVSPVRDKGLTRLQVGKQQAPHLHDVFTDLSVMGIEMLDIDLDLDDRERELLIEHGILVEADSVPEASLFCCMLDDVEPSNSVTFTGQVIVHPSFRFSDIRFDGLATRLQEEHLSGRPSVWVTEDVTGIARGYWFKESEQISVVSKFEPGKPLSVALGDEFFAKLFAAGILTTENDLQESIRRITDRVAEAHEKFSMNKYAIFRQLLPPEQMAAMRDYYRRYIDNGFMPFDDAQARRFYQHNEPLATVFHKQLTTLMCEVTGEEVIPSYVYAASYIDEADLKPHIDREQCEFSISFQVDYTPEQENHISPWGLFLQRPEDGTGRPITYSSMAFPAASQAADLNPVAYLASGDGLIYKGRELIHYRYPLSAGGRSTSLFFHYVAKGFTGLLQ